MMMQSQVLFCLCVSFIAPFDSIAYRLNHAALFQQMFPQEKVYLHFDNTGYFKGERMWFKAYVTKAGLFH